jgi:enediyne biosynthesis protein E5
MRLQLFKDARYFQIIFQITFLSYGIAYLNWRADWWLYTTYIATSLVAQCGAVCLVNYSRTNLYSGIKSAVISSLGLCLLLKTNDYYIAIFAALLSILSKYIIRINGKHIFNPSALGIAVTVWVCKAAWISPGQWGSSVVLFFAVVCLGFIITTKVQKLDISLAFIGTYGLLLFARQVLYQGWPMDYFIQSISTGSLLLFSFFMITDPRTTPNHPAARIIWSMLVAAVAFYLTAFKFMNGAPILVLILAQPLVPLLDKLFKAKKFLWQPLIKKQIAIH